MALHRNPLGPISESTPKFESDLKFAHETYFETPRNFPRHRGFSGLFGMGRMELRCDRLVIERDTAISIDARGVDAPGYRVDNQGRILGKGHATRDIATWFIPLLW
jgi:hypothetical protein